jgi:hypothetical protein
MSAERFTAVYSRAPTNPPNQDVMTMGLSFVNYTGWSGSGGTSLTNTIRAAVETAWDTFDTVWKAYRSSYTRLLELNWHDQWPAGPPPHGALRKQSRNVPGTGAANSAMPPQVAVNCTLESASRRHWGRFSLGSFTTAPSSGTFTNNDGTLDVTPRGIIAAALDAFLESCVTGGALPVVYRRPKWVDKEHTTLESGGSFYPVIGSRVDSVFDIIRRRRWEHTQAADRTINSMAAYSPATWDLNYVDTVV